MKLSSPVFDNGGVIPIRYSCKGDEINPPLIISEVPGGTKSLALIMDDPDAPAGTWVHWVVWNINPNDLVIPEGGLPTGSQEGINTSGKIGYQGPCPPDGVHRYYFHLYALDTEITLAAQVVDKAALEAGMDGHIIEKYELMGTFSK